MANVTNLQLDPKLLTAQTILLGELVDGCDDEKQEELLRGVENLLSDLNFHLERGRTLKLVEAVDVE